MARLAVITGGTGFVGGHLIRLLREDDWDVVALHRPGSDTGAIKAMGAEPREAVLHDAASVQEAMPLSPDAVFHVAGNTSMWRKHNREQYRDNVLGTRAMVRAALTQQAGRFIHTSSISAWGIQDQPIDESTPSNAAEDWISYNRTKYLAEKEVDEAISEGLDAVFLNPCGIIGAGDRHNWSQMISLIDQGKLPGVPPGSGSFCHVIEVARAHRSAYYKGRTGARYILAGVEASFLELAQTIGRLLDKPAPKRPIPAAVIRLAGHIYPLFSLIHGKEPSLTPEKVALVTHRVIADGRRAEQELGFDGTVALETMLRECIDWMREEDLLA
jgi:dihydroflavonol-4-reductase